MRNQHHYSHTQIISMALIVIGAFLSRASAEDVEAVDSLQRMNLSQTKVFPDRFLHRWDPITVFFPHDTGPGGGVSEDNPETYIVFKPRHPGAFTWIDNRTLQFRPADPWPPLKRFVIETEGSAFELEVLLPAPLKTIPPDASTGLAEIESVSMEFPDEIDLMNFRQSVSLEVSPLPGAVDQSTYIVSGTDLEIKRMERKSNKENVTYLLTPRSPIPLGHRVKLLTKMSLMDPTLSSDPIIFSTAEPFCVRTAGLKNIRLPIQSDGSRYLKSQALSENLDEYSFFLEFSSIPGPLNIMDVRNLVRFSPPVAHLDFALNEKMLEIKGRFLPETVYQAVLSPVNIKDSRNYPLKMTDESELFFFFPKKQGSLRWGAGQGIIEQYGPQMIPVDGREDELFDLRVYTIDPLDMNFWPFPLEPVPVDEYLAPPGPGEEPVRDENYITQVSSYWLDQVIPLLGSPQISEFIKTPFQGSVESGTFGLDMRPYLERISGKDQPGTYLLGLKRLSDTTMRMYMRVQVTDLCLTTAEESDQVKFFVTSLSTGSPVQGALISIESAQYGEKWKAVYQETTDAQGTASWKPDEFLSSQIRRIHVEHDDDILVLDPSQTPDVYSDNFWNDDSSTWLQWTQYDTSYRKPSAETLCHIFTDRPVYRPGDEVHIRGYIRTRDQGVFSIPEMEGTVVIEAPGNFEFREPVTLTETGGFYVRFQKDKIPTGSYRVYFENGSGYRSQSIRFRFEEYRIPQFEVLLHSPDSTGLDTAFNVSLTANYYSGGKVADRPIRWRVTQYPLVWSPPDEKGFAFSSLERFSDGSPLEIEIKLDTEARTDEDGYAEIQIDATSELTAKPRSYVVEATVTGADDQTVTSVKRIDAMPPFILGLRVPRFLENSKSVNAEAGVWGTDSKLLAGQPIHVRLLKREWHSHLRASDFTSSSLRYETDTIDELISETDLTSKKELLSFELGIPQAGVYILEIESHDRLGRVQVASSDFFSSGTSPVTWSKPLTNIFRVVPDKDSYQPGETATLILKSPFLNANALVAIESLTGNRYEWLPVQNGTATFQMKIQNTHAPRIPVHFLLMRGRNAETDLASRGSVDLGKPQTVAATAWLQVTPTDNKITMNLTYPEKAKPGTRIDVGIELKNAQGKPVPGEVTLWLVDAAVLALGKERNLDPIPDFILQFFTQLSFHDTRFMPFGFLPKLEEVGGGAGDEGDGSIFDKASLRKNFKTVPYYNPSIKVDSSGKTSITIDLPDDVTIFKIRAKVVSEAHRFGYATGQVAVRIPVVVQPNLPRFVRPGDMFKALAIGRVVEGEGGEGIAQIEADGATVEGDASCKIEWKPNVPVRVEFDISIPDIFEGSINAEKHVLVRTAVSRLSDDSTDAAEIKIPVRNDREIVTVRRKYDVKSLQEYSVVSLPESAQEGSVTRTLMLANRPELIKISEGLQFLVAYPLGCTEQRVSQSRSILAFRNLKNMTRSLGGESHFEAAVKNTIEYIKTAIRPNGLVAFYPGSQGYVTLTAWVFQFLSEAKSAGYEIDEKIYSQLRRSLEQSLRSDYQYFINGEEFSERCHALLALGQAGLLDSSYLAELARKSQWLDVETASQIAYLFSKTKDQPADIKNDLNRTIWTGLSFQMKDGKETYQGLASDLSTRHGLCIPSEHRALASAVRALRATDPNNSRMDALYRALLEDQRFELLQTNATAEILMLMAEILQSSQLNQFEAKINVKDTTGSHELTSETAEAFHSFILPVDSSSFQWTAKKANAKDTTPANIYASEELRYFPSERGSKIAAKADGFAVVMELLKYDMNNLMTDKITVDTPGREIQYRIGDIIENHIQVVNPKDAFYTVVSIPLAAGMELLNPNLETSPPESKPVGRLTIKPSYTMYLDDKVLFFYDEFPQNTYDFYFRTRASIPGKFTQPPAQCERMYDSSVRGNTPGATIEIIP